jgi:hypothetical protein
MLGSPRLALMYVNEGLAGIWVASTQQPTLPATNLSTANRNRVWRSAATTAQWARVALPSAKAIDGVALVGGNLTASATITIRGHTSDSWGSPAFTDTLTPWVATRTGVLFKMFATTQTYQYWRIEMSDAANPDGHLQVGVVALGPMMKFTVGPGAFTYTPVDPSIIAYAPSGTPYRTSRRVYAQVDFVDPFVLEADVYGALQGVARDAGKHADMVLSLFPSTPSIDEFAKALNLYGSVLELESFIYRLPTKYGWRLSFRESL